MKIGILTHHYVKNYGAFLQMKGMYETIKRLYPNADVLIIDYVNGKHWIKNIIHVLHYRRSIDNPFIYSKKIRQLLIFTKYEMSLPRTKKVNCAEDITKLDLDLIILGSDEIWNLHSSGYHPLKFGCGLENINIVAYAPSVGAVTDDTVIPEEIKEGLINIKRVSGRDIETIKFLKRATDWDATKMLDPTFLYNFDKDIKVEGIQPKPYKYILIYDCKLTDVMIEKLQRYAKKKKYKILGAGDYKPFYDDQTIDITPYEWVDLFRNAEKIVTGTFHGTVFALKYDKEVVCYPTEINRINKISSLLADMGMSERLLRIGREAELINLLDTKLDYSHAHCYIEQKKREAEIFLQEE